MRFFVGAPPPKPTGFARGSNPTAWNGAAWNGTTLSDTTLHDTAANRTAASPRGTRVDPRTKSVGLGRIALHLVIVSAAFLITACGTSPPVIAVGDGPRDRALHASALPADDARELRTDGFTTDAENPLAALIELGLEHSPKLRGARAQWEAARQRPVQIALPPLRVEYTYFPEPMMNTRHRVMAMQTVPWPGRRAREADALRHEADAEQLAYEAAVRDLIAQITVQYHEVVYLQRAVEIAEANYELNARLAELAEAWQAREDPPAEEDDDDERFAPPRRSVAVLDALKARSQQAQLAYDQITLAENLQNAEAELRRLVGVPAEALPEPQPLADVTLQAELAELTQRLLVHRQELQRAAAQTKAAGRRTAAAQLLAVPDITLGAEYAVQHDQRDAVGISVGLSLPWWGSRVRAAAEEAAQLEDVARAAEQQAAYDAQAELVRAFTQYQRAQRLVNLYRNVLLPEARAAAHKIESLEREGETTLGEVLEAQMVSHNFELALARARTERFQAVARLEQLIGQPLADVLNVAEEGDEEGDE